jgi:hypothetical protein
MKHVVDALGLSGAMSTRDECNRADRQPEHGHHQQEDQLTRESQSRQCFFRIDEPATHGRIHRKGQNAQHVQPDDRHGQFE